MNKAARDRNGTSAGSIEVIVGCMFSGKTETLIQCVRTLRQDGFTVAVFRPLVDARSPKGYLRSHSGLELAASVVQNASDLEQQVMEADHVVAIDEAQFFDEHIIDVCLDLAESGKHLLVAGLDLDFRGMPFGPMPQLLACAEVVHKLAARCTVCGKPAFFSQRLVDGRPATFYEKIVLLGGSELYEPRCRRHHEVPGRPVTIARKTKQNLDWRLQDWAERLRAIGQNGLNFSEDTFDRERYGELLSVAAEIGSLGADNRASIDFSQASLPQGPSDASSSGYVTPKVAVAVAVFDHNDTLLLVQRIDTLGWALPGGWADVGLAPSENAIHEVHQETGLRIQCDGLIGIYDTRLNPVGLSREPTYTLLFHGKIVEGQLSQHREEILDARFFVADKLPELRDGAAAQIADAIDYHDTPNLPRFD